MSNSGANIWPDSNERFISKNKSRGEPTLYIPSLLCFLTLSIKLRHWQKRKKGLGNRSTPCGNFNLYSGKIRPVLTLAVCFWPTFILGGNSAASSKKNSFFTEQFFLYSNCIFCFLLLKIQIVLLMSRFRWFSAPIRNRRSTTWRTANWCCCWNKRRWSAKTWAAPWRRAVCGWWIPARPVRASISGNNDYMPK